MDRMLRKKRHSGRKGWTWGILLLILLSFFLGACGTGQEAEAGRGAPPEGPTRQASAAQAAEDGEVRPEREIVWKEAKTGSTLEGTFQGQRDLIEAYLSRYYGALETFEEPDFSDIFASDAGDWQSLHEEMMSYLIGLRSMQRTDLRLAGYRSELVLEEAPEEQAGPQQVTLTETSIQNFSEHPEVDSVLYGIRHTFVFARESGRWLIEEHTQWDGIFWNMVRELGDGGLEGLPDPAGYFAQRRESLLEEARAESALRREDAADGEKAFSSETWEAGENGPSRNPELMPYDREAAAAYGASWVGRRNEDWWDYSRQGGNCQNFVSQCLHAGGIPMDTQGDAVWKWYGEAINDLEEGRGCSASWINVDYFYQYARENEGYGLAARTDVSYWEGDVGDVILMGPAHDLNHSVLISRVVRDKAGNTVDYLIHSNTSDVKDFPVSAYPNPRQVLVRVLGWRRS